MEFQVPQFIEQKPKIVGPLTLGQFLYILGAGAISFVSNQFFSTSLWLFISFIAFAIALAMAFAKINGEPFNKMLIYFLKFMSINKTYTWQRKITSQTLELDENMISKARKQMSIQEKLKSLSLKVTLGKMFKPPIQEKTKNNQERYEVVSFITGEREIAKRVDYN